MTPPLQLNAPLKGPPPLSPEESERRKRLIADVLRDLAAARDTLMATNPSEENGLLTALRYCAAHDRSMKRLFHWATRVAGEIAPDGPSMALIAQGGYGRRQLSLFSDIDLLFLLPPANAERAETELRLLLYVLFDLKLDLGNTAKTPEEAVACVGTDLDSTTALTEARLLAGPRPLYDDLMKRLERRLRGEGRRWFLNEVAGHREERHKKHGASVYMLEPNIKENEGGLRDLHTVAWLSYAAFGDTRLRALARNQVWSESQLERARAGRAFLLRLRNELHAMEGRRADTLRAPAQGEAAARLGYAGDEFQMAEELMLRDYYLHARGIFELAEQAIDLLIRSSGRKIPAIVQRLRRRRVSAHMWAIGPVTFLDDKFADWFLRNPRNIFAAAALAAREGLRLSRRSMDRIRYAAGRLQDGEWRGDPRIRDYFLEILSQPRNGAATLRALHETGMLAAYLPEWEHLFCLVRSDYYHSYTVDEHLLKCVEAAEDLRNKETDPVLRKVADEIERWDLLNFSLLVHDIGKGLGGAHALRGAQMVERIAFRLDVTDEDRAMMRFLVLYHLKMSHTAQRRDLMDDRVIEEFAREIGSLDRLRMLYIHTVCDMRGVGPNGYNDWRAQLLRMLYERAEMALKGRRLPHPERPDVLPAVREGLLARLGAAADVADADDFLASLSDRYFLYVQTSLEGLIERIAAHYRLTRALTRENRVEWSLRDVADANYSELFVASFDEPGVFAKLCGALASKDINILSADIFSSTDGYAVNTLLVTDSSHNRLPEGFRMDRLKRDLNEALHGRLDMAELIARSRKRKTVQAQRAERHPPQVNIDNSVSDSFTVIEIYALDRTGLLYDVTSVLHREGISIDLALIHTAAYYVVDSLYVSDVDGEKIHGEKRREELKRKLLDAIGPAPEPS